MLYLQLLNPQYHTVDKVQTLIHTIWPQLYAEPALAATIEDAFDRPNGQVFLIVKTLDGYQPRAVGITGYFDVNADTGTAYLRWTGIIPAYRREGIFAATIKLLTLQLRGANPAISRLIELVPLNEYGRSEVMPAFERVGFKPDPVLPIPEGEDSDWPVVPYVLYF